MGFQNLDKNTKVTRVLNATVVGITTVNGSIIDMQGYESVEFHLLGGTITDGLLSIKAQEGNDPALADAADLAGTLTTLQNADDNKIAVLDVVKPVKRYLRPVAVRGGATGAVIDGIVAIQYAPRSMPVLNDATTVGLSKTVVSPAEGTA